VLTDLDKMHPYKLLVRIGVLTALYARKFVATKLYSTFVMTIANEPLEMLTFVICNLCVQCAEMFYIDKKLQT
jgi:hypothetical protein